MRVGDSVKITTDIETVLDKFKAGHDFVISELAPQRIVLIDKNGRGITLQYKDRLVLG